MQGIVPPLLLACRKEGCRAWGWKGVAGMLQLEADGVVGRDQMVGWPPMIGFRMPPLLLDLAGLHGLAGSCGVPIERLDELKKNTQESV
jgi:hypothetical protein